MEWEYLQDEGEIIFDVELLEQIEKKNNEKVVSTLRDAKSMCSAVDISEATLLHYAAKYGNEDITIYLIKSESKVNLQDKDGNTPLLLATKGQHLATIIVLLKSGADIDICNSDGENALRVAVHTSPMNNEIAKIFLQRVSNSCLSDNAAIGEKLARINCPLYVTVLLKNVALIGYTLIKGGSVDAKDPVSGKTALHVAVENFHEKTLDVLLSLGADVNAQDASGKTPLAMLNDLSKWNQFWNIINMWFHQKPMSTLCDGDGFMQMRWILQNGTSWHVTQVLESLRDVTVTDMHHQNVIHYLAKNSNQHISQLIKTKKLLYQIDVNARDANGLTPLHIAMSVGNTSMVEYLVRKHANMHVTSKDGLTPFLQAINSKCSIETRTRCVRILVLNNAHTEFFMVQYFKIHNTESAINRDFAMLKPVIANLALWKAIVDVPKLEIWQKIDSYPNLKQYFDDCTRELNKMKKHKLSKKLTVFDVLVLNDKLESAQESAFFEIKSLLIKRTIRAYQSNELYCELLKNRACHLNTAFVCQGRPQSGLYRNSAKNYVAPRMMMY